MTVRRCDRCFGKFDDAVQKDCTCIDKVVAKPEPVKAKAEVKP